MECYGGFIRPRRPHYPISQEESVKLELKLFLEICWRLVGNFSGNCRDLHRVLLLCHRIKMHRLICGYLNLSLARIELYQGYKSVDHARKPILSLSAAVLNLEQKVPLSSLPFLPEEEGGSSGGRKRESSIKCATPLKIAHIDENYERTSMAALPPPLPISNHLRSSGPNLLIHIMYVQQ